ncbi:LLM class flavin-dependent oxidoreductase [Streptomyces macrosporus]|uniref:LLM class flavin-dependent oxidoreductase n=1 Tax=Streptomyces macrosporus TaxID=44032 RepID=UPI0031D3B6B3
MPAEPVRFASRVPNVSGGLVTGTIEQRTDWGYDYNRDPAVLAENNGFEYALGQVRYMAGYGAEYQHESTSFSLALLLATRRLKVIAAVHPGLWHPGVLAKLGATADHLSGGRFAVNVVSGWFKGEFTALGEPWLEHDERYRRAEEFIRALRVIWTEDHAELAGDFYRVRDFTLKPKPVDVPGRPHPEIFQGGNSTAARAKAGATPYTEVDLLKDAGPVTLLGPVEHGGGGQNRITAYRVVREVSKADGSIGRLLGHHHLWNWAARLVGTREQWEHVEAEAARNRWFFGGAVNPRDNDVVVRDEGGTLVLTGRKTFSTGSKVSDVTVLEGVLEGTIQLVFVDFHLGIAASALETAAAYTRTRTRPWLHGGHEKAVDEPYVVDVYGDLTARLWAVEALADAVAAEGLDRFWRNVRTHILHVPVAYERREVGRHVLIGELPRPTWYS